MKINAMTQTYGLTVLSEQPGGGHQVEMKFLTLSMKMDQAGKTMIDYNSEKGPADTTKDPQIAAIQKLFQGIIGKKLEYYLNATNGVDHVEGVDALMSQLGSGGMAGATAGLKNMFNEDYLQLMIGDNKFLPANGVQPGDTWPVQYNLSAGGLGNMEIDNTLNFSKWEQHGECLCARLEFNGTIKGKAANTDNPTAMKMEVQDGTLSGISWFDPELGTVIDSSMNQDLNMSMTMTMKARGKTTTQTMKMAMHQVLEIKLDSVK